LRNERPDRVLGFDDDVGDHVGPASIDALNRRQRQVLPQVGAGYLRWHNRRLTRQADVESAEPKGWRHKLQCPKDVPRERPLKPLIGRCATGRSWPPQPVWMMRRDDELFAVVPSHLVATISGCDESCRTGRQFSRSRSTARLMAA
jgi:hypothetical protein